MDAILTQYRWLYCVWPDASKCLCELQHTWARLLLAAPPWGNAAVVSWELDWVVSGMGRAIIDLTKKRAKLWLLPEDDLYRRVFVRGVCVCGTTWAYLGSMLLESWGILDIFDLGGEPVMRPYNRYVYNVVLERCSATQARVRARHRLPLPYVDVTAGVQPNLFQRSVIRSSPSWPVLISVRSLCRVRAGLVVLGHRGGRISRAAVQNCIFCGCESSSIYAHVFLTCRRWVVSRKLMGDVLGYGVGTRLCPLIDLLRLVPGCPQFDMMSIWCREVDNEAKRFWTSQT